MLRTFKAFQCFVLTACITMTSFGTAFACDRTSLVLDSIVPDGGNYRVHATFCVGGGILGSTKGASDWTDALYFFVWGPPSMNSTAFAPDTLTSDTTRCAYQGTPLGALTGVPVFGTVDFALAYLPTASCQYACVSAAGNCGLPHSDCKQVVLSFDMMPDSILMLGAEGAGDPFGGCWPHTDLMINFGSLPVTWASLEARQVQNAVQIDWATEMEQNNDHYEILRSRDGVNWTEIGRVPSKGNSIERTSYSFLDTDPNQGLNQYWIVQMDANGEAEGSKIVTAVFKSDSRLAWIGMVPNPTDGPVLLSFHAERNEAMTLEILEADGSLFGEQKLIVKTGRNDVAISLEDCPPGLYILQLKGNQGILRRRLVRL